MKKYLLDTNICIAILRKDAHVKEVISQIQMAQCYISEITLIDLKVGALLGKAKSTQGKYVDQQLDKFLSCISVIHTRGTSFSFQKEISTSQRGLSPFFVKIQP